MRMKNYESYSAEQFLNDAFFIEWVKYQTPESESFWNAWIQSRPANLNVMREAEGQLRAFLSVQRIEVENGEAEQVWSRIQRTLEAPPVPGEHRVAKVRPLYRSWWAAAAVLLFLAVGVWFLMSRQSSVLRPQAGLAKKVKDIGPGGNKAILTLADGTKVALDTAGNGAIGKQGSVTVIKLDGKLAYNKVDQATGEALYNTITTPKGGQYQLVLADGTKVWLNAASSLRFPTAFAGQERRVELTGEGYFEVAHNAERPFHVSVGEMDVQVLGTHFNVNAYNDEAAIKTTLLEGSVLVKARDLQRAVVIQPGQQAKLSTNQLSVDKNVDVEEVVAWKNGLFQFSGATMKTIMNQIGRWYNVEASFAGDTQSVHISGRVSRNLSLSQVIEVLEESGIEVKRDGNRVIASPKP